MIIVSDTSPITNLAAIARLDLLEQLYEKVVVPAAVYRELSSHAISIYIAYNAFIAYIAFVSDHLSRAQPRKLL